MTEKAVDTMLEKASELPEYSETTRPNTYFKSGFRLGYHQAEKDNELTWEQIYSILYFEREVLREFGNEEHSNEEVCKEVLKRFKEIKEIDTRE